MWSERGGDVELIGAYVELMWSLCLGNVDPTWSLCDHVEAIRNPCGSYVEHTGLRGAHVELMWSLRGLCVERL